MTSSDYRTKHNWTGIVHQVLEAWRSCFGDYQTDYYWVVICKNHRFHRKDNLGYEHHIPLGETDGISPLPMLTEQIMVRCDNCGREHLYKLKKVLRAEMPVSECFTPTRYSDR